ncbi:ubiquitin carboxyl-terminal hydrolase 37-like [Spinachia spinachia]
MSLSITVYERGSLRGRRKILSGKDTISKKVVAVVSDESQQTLVSQRSVVTSQDDKWSWSLCRRISRVTPACEENNPEEQYHPTTLRQQKIKCLGFPNPGHICYMNSCLQSLLTLKDFVSAISCQEHLWNLMPEAAVIRAFMDIQRSHLSDDVSHKIELLMAFKSTICSQEFQDYDQKDSHEFLTCVLQQMRSLSPKLQMMAAIQGRSYSCPVEDHIVFKMANTRTCKGCGIGSTIEEQFTNLSLDVVPRDVSVQQMLQDFVMVRNTACQS